MTIPALSCLLNDTLGLSCALSTRWQHRVRSNPKIVEKVLAEVKMLKQESRITKSPAAAAEDLYKRWNEPPTQTNPQKA